MKCYICSKSHWLADCDEYLKKNSVERYEFIKHLKLCTACFSSNHFANDCVRGKCRVCGHKHHTTLHRERPVAGASPGNRNAGFSNTNGKPSRTAVDNSNNTTSSTELPQASNSSCLQVKYDNNNTVILPSVVVYVKDQSGRRTKARLLFDNCSQATLVTEEFIRRFKPRLERSRGTVIGVNGSKSILNFRCKLIISSRFEDHERSIGLDVISNIGYIAPERTLNDIKRAHNIERFGEESLANGRVDILLGAEYVEHCMLNRTWSIGDLVIRDTIFGCTAIGKHNYSSVTNYSFCNLVIDEQLRKFWETEECGYQTELKEGHHECEEHFRRTFRRDEFGRFVVRLPFKTDPLFLADTRTNALNCFKRTESKLDVNVKSNYNEFLSEYFRRNEMEIAPPRAKGGYYFYLPHHAVIKESSSTTKLRVVFNASAKNASGISLNESLMVGPNIQPNLFDIIVRFRSFRYAFTADIEKMYRQVVLDKSDRDFQRIFWRGNAAEPIQEYRLATVTYGTAPASFLATRCLVVLADQVYNDDPIASYEIRNSFYMDDLMSGSDNEDEAIQLRSTIHATLDSGCFPLRKYRSNSPKLLSSIGDEFVEQEMDNFIFESDTDTQLLGVLWNSRDDHLRIRVELPQVPELITKRVILSEISRIFDPLGIVSPVTITAKILLQSLWKEQLSWDAPVSIELAQRYLDYRRDVLKLSEFALLRCYKPVDIHTGKFELHGFSDASTRAYAAVVYFRCIDKTGNIFTNLVASKTRVAPLKTLTIPRLELSGALLLSELLVKIAAILKIDRSNVFAYSDSNVVLGWLRKPPETWQLFVCNRTRKIITDIPAEQWQYVNTKVNPADLASRGVHSDVLNMSELWKYGPDFLKNDLRVTVTRGNSYQNDAR